MKSEERHELNENFLSTWLRFGLVDFLKKNGSYILLAASLCLLGFMLWKRHVEGEVAKTQTAFNKLYEAEKPGAENRVLKLNDIIQQQEKIRPVCALALRDLGNYYLETVASGTVDDAPGAAKVNTQEALDKAKEAFDRVIKDFSDQPLAFDAARLGLGQIAEDKHDWAGAKKIYEALAAQEADSGNIVASIASTRLKRLEYLQMAPPLAALALTEKPATMPMPGNLVIPSATDSLIPTFIPPTPTTQHK